MYQKFNIGDKAIIIKSKRGNEGKIVMISAHFDPSRETYDGKKIHKDCVVVVTSLGTPLRKSGNRSAMSGPMDPAWLRKLPSVDEPQLSLRA